MMSIAYCFGQRGSLEAHLDSRRRIVNRRSIRSDELGGRDVPTNAHIVCSEQSLGSLTEREGGFSILLIASHEGTIGDHLSKQVLLLLMQLPLELRSVRSHELSTTSR